MGNRALPRWMPYHPNRARGMSPATATDVEARVAWNASTVRRRSPGPRRQPVRERPRVAGKFLSVGDEKLPVRGVTYGGFRRRDGLNAVRTYTVPRRQLLDAAARHGLRVMVGLPWEQHVAFLEEADRARSITQRVREGVRACASHPALLCYAVGNEIPAPIVRWHGRRRIERFIERLWEAAKLEDPEGLVTYVNFPSTEYLELPFLDIACFNVYLEQRDRLEAYLTRLHNLAGERPLLMAEIGLDSRRNGEEEQARTLEWQVQTAASSGCAGAFVFAWTDEWHRGGHDIEDWDFGLTRRDRSPKPALRATAAAFADMPLRAHRDWPRVSVVVCSCNGARTLRDSLEGLNELDYPNYELIVVNDGSTDRTSAIVEEFPRVRLINTENRGLSSARNTGLRAATGEIVAYIDDDARPDPHWLTYLVHTLHSTPHAGIGGPNVAPAGDGPIADCVANAPGGPIHVLLSDEEAEHIPGCNMAFRRECLEAVGGFDPQFRAAGDDVDLCWRLQQRGWTLGFSPAAMVWHHRRNSLRAYWKQQRGYGNAEALLERKWPEKYNAAGHVDWAGRLYGNGLLHPARRARWRVYYGRSGSALFQYLYRPPAGTLASMPLMPEWYLLVALLAALSAMGAVWRPLLAALPLLSLALATLVVQAARGGANAAFATPRRSRGRRFALRLVTASLYLAQPVARLRGRLRIGLTPWRRRAQRRLAPPRRLRLTHWSEEWASLEDWVGRTEAALLARRAAISRGGDYDRWDLEVRSGPFGRSRARLTVEEHGAGRQLVRLAALPLPSRAAGATAAAAAAAVGVAAIAGAVILVLAVAALALSLVAAIGLDSAAAAATLRSAFERAGDAEAEAR
jgi:GT2 family glycosyltransferase